MSWDNLNPSFYPLYLLLAKLHQIILYKSQTHFLRIISVCSQNNLVTLKMKTLCCSETNEHCTTPASISPEDDHHLFRICISRFIWISGRLSHAYIIYFLLLGALEKFRKATISFVMSVRLSIRHSFCLSVCLSVCPSAWKNSTSTGGIFLKLDSCGFFESLSRKSELL